MDCTIPPPKTQIAEVVQRNPTQQGLINAIKGGGCSEFEDLDSLFGAVRAYGERDFYERLLPFICVEALMYEKHWVGTSLEIIDHSSDESKRIVSLSQRQCLCIQCNAFLCAWPERTSNNCSCYEFPDLPSINLDEMMRGKGNRGPQVAKCHMFLHYVAKQCKRLSDGEKLDRIITFVRSKRVTPSWQSSTQALCRIAMQPLKESIDSANGAVRADFANKYVGGGSIAYGCVQEEIMFACHPELNCARLMFTFMQDDESFILCGAERFATPGGYAFNLRCDGPYDDKTAVVQLREGPALQVFVSAIDAVDFRGQPTIQQYTPPFVERDLLKAYAGFSIPDALQAPKNLATGNWGAGAFLGDPYLKALIQWAAASEAGHDQVMYFPFDNQTLFEQLPQIQTVLLERQTTVGDLCKWLLSGKLDARRNILMQLENYLSGSKHDTPETSPTTATSKADAATIADGTMAGTGGPEKKPRKCCTVS